MRAITVIKVCVASLVLLTSIDSNAEMARLDFKGTLGDGFPLTSSGDLSDIALGDKFQGYFLINTDAPFDTAITPDEITYYLFNPPPGTPLFIDGSIEIGNHTFSVSAINTPYIQAAVANASGVYAIGDITTNKTTSLTFSIGLSLPPTSTPTDLVQIFSLQIDAGTTRVGI